MKKLEIISITENEAYGYDLHIISNEINNRMYILKTGINDYSWVPEHRGKELIKLKDNGNGVKIKLKSGKTIKLDYGELEEFRIMLDYYNHRNDKFVEKYFEEKDEQG